VKRSRSIVGTAVVVKDAFVVDRDDVAALPPAHAIVVGHEAAFGELGVAQVPEGPRTCDHQLCPRRVFVERFEPYLDTGLEPAHRDAPGSDRIVGPDLEAGDAAAFRGCVAGSDHSTPTDQRWLWREARLHDPDGNVL